MKRAVAGALFAVLLIALAVFVVSRAGGPAPASPASTAKTAAPAAAPVGAIRLSGTVEAVRAATVIVPRLAGQTTPTLVVTRMVAAGARVRAGDVLVEFDPQDQLRNATDRRAEVVDLDGQIAKKRNERAVARAADETALAQAEHDLERAKLEMLKNELIPKVEAEKNTLAFEQATARRDQLKKTLVLKEKAGAADLKILEIRRERSARALKYAENNATLMTVRATFPGVAVIKSVWKGNTMSEVAEGEEVRPGTPIVDVVDPDAMQVRARINQADIGQVVAGQTATVRLDAYPELSFEGRIEIVAPLGMTSSMTPTVHTFIALVSIKGTHPKLMPDLTASVDLAAPAQGRRPARSRADMAASRLARRLRWSIGAILIVAAGVATIALVRRGGPVSAGTVEVTRGEFVDLVEVRGDVRPLKSIIISAPMQAGELQILKLVASGASVTAGEVVVQFDPAAQLRTIQEKESELRQALDELAQAKAQASITTEQDRTSLLHSKYDVDRAKLGLSDEQIISRIEAEKGKLALADAQQRLREAEVKDGANREASVSGFSTQESRIAKVRADLERARKAAAALEVKAPSSGVVSLMQNYRASNGMGPSPDFRAGDRAWAGAQILELPDLSSVRLVARLDESDRGRLQLDQAAVVRLDAVADREYHATVTDLSVLARVDFSSWPPVKQFDLKLTFTDPDPRLRPGMSAAARVAVGRIPDQLLVPAESVFLVDGRAVVYRVASGGRAFEIVPVEVVKRGKEQAAIKGAIRQGDRVASKKPDADVIKGGS